MAEQKAYKQNKRADHQGAQRRVFDKNRQRILMSQDTCAICGKPVDKTLNQYDPMAPQIDHIIPISKGGHPSDISNLCLVHACCNRAKSDKVFASQVEGKPITNQILPWTIDWLKVPVAPQS